MGKRGIKPKGKVKIKWSPAFAYAIGLLVTDGNLSPDGRHIVFTSKDLELARLFQHSLGIKGHIGRKDSGANKEKKYFVVQFGDILFYRFLVSIGLMPNKTKVIKKIVLPARYFFDFLRGHLDGDGTFYSYWDPRWRSSFMFYTVFISASKRHIQWLREEIAKRLKMHGHVTRDGKKITYQLKYAKNDSLKLLRKVYYSKKVLCLSRKQLKVERALSIVGRHL